MGQAKSQILSHNMVHIRLNSEMRRRPRIVVGSEETSIQEWLSDAVERAVDNVRPSLTQGSDNK